MASAPVLEGIGLHTSDNQLSAVPEGGMVRASNAVSRYKHILESRRGQKFLAHTGTGADLVLGNTANRTNEGVLYQDVLVLHHGTSTLARNVGTAFTDYSGSYTPPDATALRMKFMEAAGNLYFNTTVGQYLLDVVSGTPEKAGIPKPINRQITPMARAAPGAGADYWQTANTSVAYRLVWGKKDANKNVKLSAPSERCVVANAVKVPIAGLVRASNVVTATTSTGSELITGNVVTLVTADGDFAAGPWTITVTGTTTFTYAETAADKVSTVAYEFRIANKVSIVASIPVGITTSHFWRLYRSKMMEDSDLVPKDEMFLVFEGTPTGTDISNGYFLYTDKTPDAFLGTPLYTNPNTGDGALAGKERPPIGKDMCWWDDRAWYLNTTDKHRFFLYMLGIGSPDGIQDSDTVTINGRTFTFKTTVAVPMEIGIETGYGSPQKNIEATARALAAYINIDATNTTLYASYVSGESDPAGKILIEERAFGGSAFSVYASRVGSWGPALTTGSSGAQTSVNDRRSNGVSYSDKEEPEAVPLVNWLPVGPKNGAILRGVPFRDKLFVFTDLGKIYAISGPAPYRVDEIDGSARLIAPDSVKVHSNQVFAFTDQGVGIVTEAGFRIVSKGIEDELLDALALTPATVARQTFGVSYEADRQYQVWVPTGNSDTCAKVGYVYNSLDSTWTKWVGNRTFGFVSRYDGRLYMGEGSAAKVREERKSMTRSDFADEAIAVTIEAVTGTTIQITDVTVLTAGDMLWQSDSIRSVILSVDEATRTVTTAWAEPFTNGSRKAYLAIPVELKWCPLAPQGPAMQKRFREVALHFREFNSLLLTATFDTEMDLGESVAEVDAGPGFGLLPFGGFPFGNPTGLRTRRVKVSDYHHKAGLIRVGCTIQEAYALWAVNGFTLEYETASERSRP